MALPLYLARTPAEMGENMPSDLSAYLALHFSPGGTGLSNFPAELPPGTMLILDDSTPMDGHDPETILKQLSSQLEQYQCESLLLDFQRPGIGAQQKLAETLCRSLPCPVAVSELYAAGLSCPVFLSPVPPDRPLAEHLRPWRTREIWLDAALDGLEFTLTETGCAAAPLFDFPEEGMRDEILHCHYKVESPATFRLWRTQEDLDALLQEAESLGVTRAIGLLQELGR